MKNVPSLSVIIYSLAVLCGCAATPRTAMEAAAESDPEAAVRAMAEQRTKAIRAKANMQVPEAAPKYYVSEFHGSDSADGRTQLTAWKTTDRLNSEKGIAPGSYVLYERGGLYRGQVVARPGVTYTAYGIGPKPRIFGSPVNGADPAKWRRTDNPKVWAYVIGHNDVGTLVFDDGAAHAIKIVIRTDRKTGAKFNKYTGRPFNSYRDLDGDLHFWHDYYQGGTGEVYLYSEVNPGERFKSIEFNVKCCGFRVGDNANVAIDNFYIAHVGVHGVSAGGFVKGLHISNCEFAWIGGSIQGEAIFGRDHPTRLGNAVEIYGWCDDYIVADCIIRDVYDAGVTHQYNIPKNMGMKVCDQKNVVYRGNVFERCCYSVEYFLTAEDGNPSRMDNVLVEDNLMLDAGIGFSEQRPDRGVAGHIRGWLHPQRNRATNYVVRNNAFCRSKDDLIMACAGLANADGSSSLPRLENNLFIGSDGDRFGAVSMKSGKSLRYGADTAAFVDTLGPGNRCIVTK